MSTVTDLESYQQFAQQQQAQNNAWSAEQAAKQMEFQERLSNTAHQREVADLKSAGLNPILSVNSGASVPNGASAEADTSTAGNVGAILQQVLQAQSAREVAGMYNAATIAAASIAAEASRYSADKSYQSKDENPGSLGNWLAKLVNGGTTGKQSGSASELVNRLNSWVGRLSSSVRSVQVNGRSYPDVQQYFSRRGWNWDRLSDNQQRLLTFAYTGFLKGNTDAFYKLLKAYKVT